MKLHQINKETINSLSSGVRVQFLLLMLYKFYSIFVLDGFVYDWRNSYLQVVGFGLQFRALHKYLFCFCKEKDY